MTSKAGKGNAAKYASYAYAFKRINQAITDEYHLEAITICESVITDRLLSYGEYITKSDIGEKATLGKVLKKIKKDKKFVVNEETEDLLEEIDAWRIKRNRCVHSVAKSKPGMATSDVGNFLTEAAACSATGKSLARKVSDWHKKIKKEHAKSNE